MEDINCTRVYYFVWDDWTYIEPDTTHLFWLDISKGRIVEKDERGVPIASFNTHYIREIGYLPPPEKPGRQEPRYDTFCNSLYKPDEQSDRVNNNPE